MHVYVRVLMHTHLNSRHLSLQIPKVAKIQAAWSTKDPLEVPLIPNTKVAHVLRQFIGHLCPGSQGQESSEDKDSLFQL